MQDLLRELFERPSRIAGWGLVVVVHVIAWQVLVHGLNWVSVMPALKAVEVTLINDAPPPTPPPAMPKMEQPLPAKVFVPAPEVKVTEESPLVVMATTVPPAPVTPVAISAAAPVYAPSPMVVSESEVDYLVRPEIRYPQASKRDRERGLVLLSVTVNTRGLVENVNIYKSSGFSRLDECAARAVRSMRVKPYVRNGIAMAIEVRIPVEFS